MRFIAFFLLCFTSSSALSEMYFGGTIGQSKPGISALNDTLGVSLGAGYEFNRYFALEGAYTSLGEFDIKNARLTGVNTSATTEVTGLEFAARAMIPFNDTVSMYMRLGVYSWDVEIRENTTGNRGQQQFKIKNSGADELIGIGFIAHGNANFAFTLDFTRYNFDISDADLRGIVVENSKSVNLLGAGVELRF